ncbi:serine hydrolase [Flavobacterium sp. 245]|uniref:serine hydrolase n=1 Tax=Flavobacterium sp. 245 TaxID=2512115 RepID=UPI00105F01E0|nr:serine hydrolase [Flavobacterium sp. 245]TDP02964.1 beta-lactamase family protein [Flavobacterium sp. 245]
MSIFKKCIFFFVALVFFSCGSKKNVLEKVLASDDKKIKEVMKDPKQYELQIIYTQIVRNEGKITFKDYTYHLDASNYFYPASTIKFPIAILALEKLNTIANTSVNTNFTIEGNSEKLKFADEITKVFAVSDNVASSNLFEFIGFDYINQKMKEKGLEPFKITHRLSGSEPSNPLVKSVTLYKDDGSTEVFPSKLNEKNTPLVLNNLVKGTGFMKGDKLVNEPFDFSKKNYYPLETLHNTLKRIIFPEAFNENERFKITDKEREFILFSMQNLPRNAGYDPKEYFDSYCKFLMFGDTKNQIPENIKIYNKIGQAYGTMTETAYIVDTENKVEFMVSATMLVNKDGIFNDNVYEYDSVSLPFFAALGRELYAKSKL